jgi:hypothetical protein
MADDVRIIRTYEDHQFDADNKPQAVIAVQFKVGDDGPFVRSFPKDGFTGFQVKAALEDFARELRSARG